MLINDFLTFKAQHPEQIKRAAVNTITAYKAVCLTDTLLKGAERSFEDGAIRNGYVTRSAKHEIPPFQYVLVVFLSFTKLYKEIEGRTLFLLSSMLLNIT